MSTQAHDGFIRAKGPRRATPFWPLSNEHEDGRPSRIQRLALIVSLSAVLWLAIVLAVSAIA